VKRAIAGFNLGKYLREKEIALRMSTSDMGLVHLRLYGFDAFMLGISAKRRLEFAPLIRGGVGYGMRGVNERRVWCLA
jgi:hypothetical protein